MDSGRSPTKHSVALRLGLTRKMRSAVLLSAGLFGLIAYSGCTILPPAVGAGDSDTELIYLPVPGTENDPLYQRHPMTHYTPGSNGPELRAAAINQSHRTPRAKPAAHPLMTKPVDSGVLTSEYGYRLNPTGNPRTRWHKGIDYAAPVGTLVYAAGDGVVVYKYHSDSYGNYLRIKHSNGYSSAYAHLHSFAKDVKIGATVKRGQVIGSVGSTGRSTGPHLHFEVMHNGKFVNPLFDDQHTNQKLVQLK